jgi:transcriptional regulator with XRE-family HTH domain
MIKKLGQRIRELRGQHDLSLREFAKKLGGLSAAHLSDIELGRRFPSEDLLSKMAQVLSVDVAELQKLDSRAPIEDLRRLAEADPAYGIALRRLVEGDIRPEDILKLVEKKSKDDLK